MRECPICPSWKRRCAHWDGQILLLGDREKAATLHTHDEVWGTLPRWAIRLVVAADLYQCGETCAVTQVSGKVVAEFSDLPAAEEEFHRREEALLA